MSEGDDKNRQIIKVALSDCENAHAFQQDLGLGSDMVFDISDFAARARIFRKVETIFRIFENQDRFRLQSDTVKWYSVEGSGELTLEFKYLDLESDEVNTFVRTFKPEE